MQIVLEKRPKSPIIIEGFPGFGLVGTISTEFLIKHLDAEQVGYIRIPEMPPIIAVHKGNAVEPLGIFYDKKYNLVILHALTAVNGLEWDLTELLVKLAKDLKAKEIISIEGVGNNDAEIQEPKAFYLGNNKKLKSIGIEELKEGIIVGVTGALLLRKDLPITCIFAETHSALPDSRASAKIIQVLDKYLGLKVDYKPLMENAEKFENKLRDLMEKSKTIATTKDKGKLSYFG